MPPRGCGRARQRVGGAPRAVMKPGTAADAEAAAFGALQEHNADKRKHDHQMHDDHNGFHEISPGGVFRALFAALELERLNTMLSRRFQARAGNMGQAHGIAMRRRAKPVGLPVAQAPFPCCRAPCLISWPACISFRPPSAARFMITATGSYVINDTMMKLRNRSGCRHMRCCSCAGQRRCWGVPLLFALGYGRHIPLIFERRVSYATCSNWSILLCRCAGQHADRGGAALGQITPLLVLIGASILSRTIERDAHGADQARLHRGADGGAADHAGFRSMRCWRSPTRCSARRAISPDDGSPRRCPA